MKKWAAWTVVGAILLSVSGIAYVSSAMGVEKPEKGILIGQAIEFSTYAMQDREGEGYVAALTNRAELGFPVGILEEGTGDIWIVVYRNPAPASGMQTGNEILAPLMGKKIVVQGLKYRAPGVNLIRISIASEY